MGQAKQRGTRAERIEQAQKREREHPSTPKKRKEKPMNILEALAGLSYARTLFGRRFIP